MSIGKSDIKDMSNHNGDSESIMQDKNAFANMFLSLSKMRIDDDDDDDYECNNTFSIHSTEPKPVCLDPDSITPIEEGMQMGNSIVEEEDDNEKEKTHKNCQDHFAEGMGCVYLQKQQVGSTRRPYPVDNFSPFLHASAPLSNDQIIGQLTIHFSSPPRSPPSERMMSASHTLTQGTGALVYSSIVEPPMCGRALDFRSFLKRQPVPPEVEEDNPAGVFVGQLPSTYSEEDIAALLCAIAADAGVHIHIRDVKSHNQSRTCAFVVINRSALQVLLNYSKRVLCDVSCVWVVDTAQAPQLKDYVSNFVRERLRGVPKAALVLEELTAQCMRRGSTAGKGTRHAEAVPGVVLPGVADGSQAALLHSQAMGVLIPQGLPIGAVAPGAFVGGNPAPMYAVRPPAALPPYGYCVAPSVPVPFPVMAPAKPGAPVAHGIGVGAGPAGGVAPMQVRRAPELRCQCGSALLQSRQVEGTCALCKIAIAAGDAAYACPMIHTLVCMRCISTNFWGNYVSTVSNIEKNVEFVQPMNYTAVQQLDHGGGSTMCTQSLPDFTRGMPYVLLR